MRLTTIICATLAFASCDCGGKPDDTGPVAAMVTITSNDIKDGVLTVVAGKSALVGITVKDSSGAVMDADPSRITWESSDESTMTVSSLGSTASISGIKDWFDEVPDGGVPDAGREPEATLTARVDDASATITVRSVVNLEGHWVALLDDTTPYALDFVQSGRTITHPDTQVTGTIDGITFFFAQFGYTLNGALSSRTAIQGTYTTGDAGTGTWSATKTP